MNQATKHVAPAKASEREKISFTLTLSPKASDLLAELAKEGNVSEETILGKALGLFKLVSDAHREGKHIGFATESDSLETEIEF